MFKPGWLAYLQAYLQSKQRDRAVVFQLDQRIP